MLWFNFEKFFYDLITKNDSHPRNPKDLKDKIDQYIEAMVCETEMYLLVVYSLRSKRFRAV